MEVLDLPLPDMIDFVDFRVTFTINGQPYIQPADDPMINDTYQKLPMNLPQVRIWNFWLILKGQKYSLTNYSKT